MSKNTDVPEFTKDWESCSFFGRPSLILRGRKLTSEERKWVNQNCFFIYDVREASGTPCTVEKEGIYVDRYGTIITWANVVEINFINHKYISLKNDFNDLIIDEESEIYYQITDIKNFKSSFNENERFRIIEANSVYPCTNCDRSLSCQKTEKFKKVYEEVTQYVKDHPEFISLTPEAVANNILMCEGVMIGYIH